MTTPSLPRRTPILSVAAICVAALMGLGIAANLYSPGPPAYTLTSSELRIHDRLFPVTLQASSVDLKGVRIVDLNQNTRWRPVKRKISFVNSHYESGWFEAADGEKVRLYRAGGSRAVVLPPSNPGVAVLYQAADPEAFVERLRAAWLPASGLAAQR